MTKLFLSYRTDDSVHATMALSDLLARHFGRARVFRDHDSLALGVLYPRLIRSAIRRCDVVLAVIGRHWLDIRDGHGRRRIDDSRDWVRTELRTAFVREIRVVPVLLDQTPLPAPEQLPEDIRALAYANCWQLRHQNWAADVRGLVEKLRPGATREDPSSTGKTYQHNNATEGGTVIANQGGNQIVNTGHPGGDRR